MRIVEQLRLEWLDHYEGITPDNPITIYAAEDVMQDLNGIQSKYGSFLSYYERMGLITKKEIVEPIRINEVKITAVPVSEAVAVSIFVFESNGKKLIYAPCDCKPFPNAALFCNADALIIGNTFIGDKLKNEKVLPPNSPLRQELHSFEDVLKLKAQFHINHVVITHIEEDWGKTYDEYCALEKEYPGIRFAYDGLILDL